MEKATFKRAKVIMDEIEHVESDIYKIKKMRNRDDDNEFNLCRSKAYEALELFKHKLEIEFKALKND